MPGAGRAAARPAPYAVLRMLESDQGTAPLLTHQALGTLGMDLSRLPRPRLSWGAGAHAARHHRCQSSPPFGALTELSPFARPRGCCPQRLGARPQGGLPVREVAARAARVAAFTGDNAPVRLRLRTGARVTPDRNHPGTAFRTWRLNVSASLSFVHISPKKSQCLEANSQPW